MQKRIVAIVAFLALVPGADAKGRTVACKTPAIATSCYWTHGRLSVYNGAVNWRLWKIGTNHLLGIYSGPATFKKRYTNGDSEAPELPPNLAVEFGTGDAVFGVAVYGDFQVCPLEPHRQGHMQAACIEDAKHLVAVKN